MISNHGILIKKSSGEEEIYSEEKLLNSLRRAGASSSVISSILDHIRKELKTGMTSMEIYNHAFSLLKKAERRSALRYNLRRALMELGPSGHPFESLIGSVMETKGYAVKVATTVKGFCVNHEVDVLASKDNILRIIEAKYHNTLGVKSDVKVILYVHSRFTDIERESKKGGSLIKHEPWIITNTKFTSDAIKYGECSKINLVGWNYTHDGNLQDLIEESGLHPISSLLSLSRAQKNFFLQKGIVLCRDLENEPALLKSLGISFSKSDSILREIRMLLGQ